jgi:hypothetical protein
MLLLILDLFDDDKCYGECIPENNVNKTIIIPIDLDLLFKENISYSLSKTSSSLYSTQFMLNSISEASEIFRNKLNLTKLGETNSNGRYKNNDECFYNLLASSSLSSFSVSASSSNLIVYMLLIKIYFICLFNLSNFFYL